MIPNNIKQHWVRSTYYTPPRNEPSLSLIPVDLFDDDDDENNNNSNQETASTSTNNNKKYDNIEPKGEPDDFGWIKINEMEWYNTITKKYINKSPYN